MEGKSRPNDPRKVVYSEPRPPIVKSPGETASERYLANLAEKSFLNLWSYPGLFIDRKKDGKGDGKELCDLLVVCGSDVIIFSDKAIGWPPGDDIELSWKRWYRRAIEKSVDQIVGAERWINEFPDRIFLDRSCTIKLPVRLPPPERRKIHGVVVAVGAAKACRQFFGGGIGSLVIAPTLKGSDHVNPVDLGPFTIGDVNPNGSFVHVLDEASLEIVMRELDTITDFAEYLTKKEKLIRWGKLERCAGEEDLVAYYMTHINEKGEHDFTLADGSEIGGDAYLRLGPGLYAQMTTNVQYIAKKKAEESSYIWDRLISAFTTHMLDGTTIVPDDEKFDLSEHEQSVRYLALVPRYMRGVYGRAISEALQLGKSNTRFTRAMLPRRESPDHETGFFFLTLALPDYELDGGYDQYRDVRCSMLEAYALAFLRRHDYLLRIVGIATEPLRNEFNSGSSEDLILVEQPDWTPEMIHAQTEREAAFQVFRPENYREYSVKGQEFPETQSKRSVSAPIGLNRKQRRAWMAERKNAKS